MGSDLDIQWHRLDRAHPPVVLLGGINLLRSLGVAGIPAIVASTDRLEPAFASRYCIGRCELPPEGPAAAAIAALIHLGKTLRERFGVRSPLMYGNDDALEWIRDYRDALWAHFAFLANDPVVAGALGSKDRFQAFAEARNLPVPRSLAWNGEGSGSLRAARGPVLIKPKLKTAWHDSKIFYALFDGASKARVFETIDEVLHHPAIQQFHEQLCFQEYIPGSDRNLWSFNGFADARGELLGSFVGRKLRNYPTETGESSLIELARNEELSALGRDIARRCPLRGPFKMDFKRDPRDGRWYLLEINPRFSLWHYLGAANGISLPAIAYEHLLSGRFPPPAAYGTRLRWLSFSLDFKAYRQLAARGELTWSSWLGSIVRSRKVYSLFAWKDPGPWLSFQAKRLGRRWRRGPGRLLGTLGRWLSSAS